MATSVGGGRRSRRWVERDRGETGGLESLVKILGNACPRRFEEVESKAATLSSTSASNFLFAVDHCL